MTTNKLSTKETKAAGNAINSRVAWVNEPDVSECRPDRKWRLRSIEMELNGRFEIEIRYRSRMGKVRTIRIDNSRRSDHDFVRKELDSHNARLPHDKKAAIAFVEKLMRNVPARSIIACSSPGFREEGRAYVMPKRLYGTANGRLIWDNADAVPGFGEIRGKLCDYSRDVLTPALESPYLTLAILIPLAGTLLDYVVAKTGRKLLRETAIFHFAGESSTGKTTLACVAQSIFSSPDIDTDYEATDRAIAEHAYRRNSLAFVIDDTESGGLGREEVWRKMQNIAQRVPSGRTRAISRKAAKADLPEMRFACFGISSGPETLAELAKDLKHGRHGDRVRMLDIQIPAPENGGIFGSALTASRKPPKDSAALVDRIEKGILKSCGVVQDAFVEYLLENDVVGEVDETIAKFVDGMASGEDGLERRFAKKFAVVAAAGVIAKKAGLLPWPDDWAGRAIAHCYRNSRSIRDPSSVAVKRAVKRLADALEDKTKFTRLARGRRPLWRATHIGLRMVDKNGTTAWLAKERLHLLESSETSHESEIHDKLVSMRFVERGQNSTSSRQFRVTNEAGQVYRVRLWRVAVKALRDWARPSGKTIIGRTNITAARRAVSKGTEKRRWDALPSMAPRAAPNAIRHRPPRQL